MLSNIFLMEGVPFLKQASESFGQLNVIRYKPPLKVSVPSGSLKLNEGRRHRKTNVHLNF